MEHERLDARIIAASGRLPHSVMRTLQGRTQGGGLCECASRVPSVPHTDTTAQR